MQFSGPTMLVPGDDVMSADLPVHQAEPFQLKLRQVVPPAHLTILDGEIKNKINVNIMMKKC